ncbi:MAG: methyltransferase [Anaerohalosphaeraceae bacterium]
MSYLYVLIQGVLIVVIGMTSRFTTNPFIFAGLTGGLVLMAWSLRTMRLDNLNVFPDLKEKSRLVTWGPYRWIRHPMYSAVLLVTLMLVLTNLTLLRFGYWVILFVDLWLKFRYEESLLLKRYPEYAEYQRTTARLIPRVF